MHKYLNTNIKLFAYMVVVLYKAKMFYKAQICIYAFLYSVFIFIFVKLFVILLCFCHF